MLASLLLDLDMNMDGMDGMGSSPSDAGMGSPSTPDSSMDMGMGGCKISMMWNWNTVGACFISSDWQVSSNAVFVGSVIGVFFLVILLEFFRRIIREYDRKIARDAVNGGVPKADAAFTFIGGPVAVRPTIAQQAIRSTLYMVQFGAGYMLMLLAMYYNGYILIFGIFMGAWAGFFLSSWDTIACAESGPKDSCC